MTSVVHKPTGMDPSLRWGEEVDKQPMRSRGILVFALLLAACARTPQVEPVRTPVTAERPSGELIGLSAVELSRRFGPPTFQVKEGPGTKLQWSRGGCVLDAYLYPPASGGGLERVTHIDARRPSGDDLDLPSCLALMER